MGNTNPNFGIQLGQNMATEAASGMLGIAMGAYNDRRQIKQQQRLQDQQIAGQKAMTDYNMQKQLEMWKATSYQAQVEQMNKAGINPALMYGMSGGGGQTAQVSPGQVTGGDAPKGGREIQDMMGIQMQMALLKAQKDNIEADTNLKNTQATKTGGVDTTEAQTRISSLTQGIQNQKAVEALTKIDAGLKQVALEIATATKQDQVEIIDNALLQSGEVLQRLTRENLIDNATQVQRMDMVKAELIGIQLKNALTQAQTTLTGQQGQKIESDIKVNQAQIDKWSAEIAQNWAGLSLEERRTKVAEMLGNVVKNKAIFDSVMTVVDKIIDFKSPVKRNPIGFGK